MDIDEIFKLGVREATIPLTAPPKHWRALWVSKDGEPVVPSNADRGGCNCRGCTYVFSPPGPYPSDFITQVLGPIYPSRDVAEAKALEIQELSITMHIADVVEVDEHGRPSL